MGANYCSIYTVNECLGGYKYVNNCGPWLLFITMFHGCSDATDVYCPQIFFLGPGKVIHLCILYLLPAKKYYRRSEEFGLLVNQSRTAQHESIVAHTLKMMTYFYVYVVISFMYMHSGFSLVLVPRDMLQHKGSK